MVYVILKVALGSILICDQNVLFFILRFLVRTFVGHTAQVTCISTRGASINIRVEILLDKKDGDFLSRAFGFSLPAGIISCQPLVTSYQPTRRHSPEDNNLATFDVLTAVLIKIQVFWDVTPRQLIKLPTFQLRASRKKAVRSSETSLNI
jgi:hypothetical protein